MLDSRLDRTGSIVNRSVPFGCFRIYSVPFQRNIDSCGKPIVIRNSNNTFFVLLLDVSTTKLLYRTQQQLSCKQVRSTVMSLLSWARRFEAPREERPWCLPLRGCYQRKAVKLLKVRNNVFYTSLFSSLCLTLFCL